MSLSSSVYGVGGVWEMYCGGVMLVSRPTLRNETCSTLCPYKVTPDQAFISGRPHYCTFAKILRINE